MGTMAGNNHEDFTLIWAFDRLLECPAIRADVILEGILPAVAARPDELRDATRAKLCLRLLDADLYERRVDDNVLIYLQELAKCKDFQGLADPAIICPSPDLILQVKTELAIQTWRDRDLPPAEAEAVLNKVFGGENTAEEYGRYEELRAALRSRALAEDLTARFPFQRLLGALCNYKAEAWRARPCTPLLVIEEDVKAGRYEIGVGIRQQGAAVLPAPSPSAFRTAAALPSPAQQQQPSVGWRAAGRPGSALTADAARPHLQPPAAEAEGVLPPAGGFDEGHASPAQQQLMAHASASRGQRSVLRNLDAGLADLAQHGGQDPLPEMLQHAADAQQQAGPAAAAAAAGGGRQIVWGNDSPAIQHPMPELPPARIPPHAPLQHLSPLQQHNGRGTPSHNAGSERETTEGAKPRRRRLGWTDEEVLELRRLVKEYGRGNWAAIKHSGFGVFKGSRTTVDLKDKWRNMTKTGRIERHEVEEIEAREAELREQLRLEKRAGRPPKFVSPKAKRPRQAISDDEGEEEEEQQQQEQPDSVEDADDADAGEEEEEEAERESEEEEDGDDQAQRQQQKQKGTQQQKRKAKQLRPRVRRSQRLNQ